MECVTVDIEGCHLPVGDLDALRIVPCVQLAADGQARRCRRGGYQFDDCLPADQGFATPGLGNVAEQPMFDLVPFRGPRRVMAYLQD